MIHWINFLLLSILIVPNLADINKFESVKATDKSFDAIASYVGKVLSDFNDQSKNNCDDVALIKFQKFSDETLFEKIIAMIPKKNAVFMPQLEKKITS